VGGVTKVSYSPPSLRFWGHIPQAPSTPRFSTPQKSPKRFQDLFYVPFYIASHRRFLKYPLPLFVSPLEMMRIAPKLAKSLYPFVGVVIPAQNTLIARIRGGITPC
jgi:hypothetical protein